MARFDVLLDDVLIGHTDLEMGDPVRGIVMGTLAPTTEYTFGKLIQTPRLVVRLSGSENELLDGVVTVDDYSADIGASVTAIEISVAGITEQNFRRFFPAHVALYERGSHG